MNSKSWSEQASTNTYADLGSTSAVWDKSLSQIATIQIWNTGDTNDIDYKVLGSLNNSDYDIEVVSETTLGEDASTIIDISHLSEGAFIPYIKIQIKSTVADTHSTVKAYSVGI